MSAAIFNHSFILSEVENFRTRGVAVFTIVKWVIQFIIAFLKKIEIFHTR